MYHKPKVERFGTFRELTQVGFNGTTDGFTICGANGGTGNELCDGPPETCRDGSPVQG
ncbi:MAG: lasso RiPP family leader peptide-containing protein [Gemmatimonadaceae bacterium]|nr:lasso RiPP family leader peptide-containing protein [Gemmatimonadaceae bacterium]